MSGGGWPPYITWVWAIQFVRWMFETRCQFVWLSHGRGVLKFATSITSVPSRSSDYSQVFDEKNDELKVTLTRTDRLQPPTAGKLSHMKAPSQERLVLFYWELPSSRRVSVLSCTHNDANNTVAANSHKHKPTFHAKCVHELQFAMNESFSVHLSHVNIATGWLGKSYHHHRTESKC